MEKVVFSVIYNQLSGKPDYISDLKSVENDIIGYDSIEPFKLACT